MVEFESSKISVSRQCDLLSIHRSGLYYKNVIMSDLKYEIMNEIDKCYTAYPFYGTRRMALYLQTLGYKIGRKGVRSLCNIMGIAAIYPKGNPITTQSDDRHIKYPYLLRHLPITQRNQVWATDITYIPMKKGFMYLCAIIDLHTRYVLAWNISNTMNVEFVSQVLETALQRYGNPEIFNTDQGSQFTSEKFTNILKNNDIRISMDGKCRALDNIFIERLWRSVKYECVYLNAFEDGLSLRKGLEEYFNFYNHERKHQSLNYKTPYSCYFESAA